MPRNRSRSSSEITQRQDFPLFLDFTTKGQGWQRISPARDGAPTVSRRNYANGDRVSRERRNFQTVHGRNNGLILAQNLNSSLDEEDGERWK